MQPYDVDNSEAAMDQIRRKIATALDQLGKEVDDQHKQLVSTPVEFVGSRIIRSKPYEAPRLETGEFRASLYHNVTVARDFVRLWHYSTDPKSVWLNEGTARMVRRPSFDRMLNYLEFTALPRFAELMKQ